MSDPTRGVARIGAAGNSTEVIAQRNTEIGDTTVEVLIRSPLRSNAPSDKQPLGRAADQIWEPTFLLTGDIGSSAEAD